MKASADKKIVCSLRGNKAFFFPQSFFLGIPSLDRVSCYLVSWSSLKRENPKTQKSHEWFGKFKRRVWAAGRSWLNDPEELLFKLKNLGFINIPCSFLLSWWKLRPSRKEKRELIVEASSLHSLWAPGVMWPLPCADLLSQRTATAEWEAAEENG